MCLKQIILTVLIISLNVFMLACASNSLHTAIVENDSKQALNLIHNKKSINEYDDQGQTPLHRAANNGRLEIVKALISAGAIIDVISRDDVQCTPLYGATYWGHIPIVQVLLGNGANIEAKTVNGSTPLLIASEKGDNKLCKFLLEKGANVNAEIESGDSAINMASMYGHIETVKLLIDNGANVNHIGGEGFTPLMGVIAAKNNSKKSYEITKLLIERGATVNSITNYGATALMFAAREGHYKLVKLLIENEADINTVSNSKSVLCDAVQYAAFNNNTNIVELLFEKGAIYSLSDKSVEKSHATAKAAELYAQFFEQKKEYTTSIKHYEIAHKYFNTSALLYDDLSGQMSLAKVKRVLAGALMSGFASAVHGSAGTGKTQHFSYGTSDLNRKKQLYDYYAKSCSSHSKHCNEKILYLSNLATKEND